jgi:hypothetical protein
MLHTQHGLIGDRIPGKPEVWSVGHLLYDVAAEHSKIIDGAILDALREIEGRIPYHEEMHQLSKLLHDETNNYLMTIMWKGKPILEVCAPEYIQERGRTVIKRRIKQVWKQSHDRRKG